MGASTHPTTFHPRYACLNLSSKGNTTLNGAQAIARRIDADVGGKLSIISPQDTVEQSITQSGVNGRVQVSFGTAWEASGSYNSSQASGSLNAVNKQSGLFAGDGGYHIQTDSVDLKGGAITSTADQDHNDLTANALTFEDIHNRNRFSAQTVSLSGSYGNNNTEASKGKGYTYGEGYNSGVGYTPSLPQSQSGSDSATTYATFSPGNITLNGQATTVEALGIHSDAATAHRAVAGLPDLQAILDRQKTVSEATATIASAVQTYSKNQAKEANQAKAEAQADFEAALRQRNDGSWEAYQSADPTEQEAIRLSGSSAYREAAEAAQSWGTGGDKSRALTATTALISGMLGGQTDLQAAANAAAPYAAAWIGQTVGHGESQNEAAQTVGHFLLGATLAYINNSDPLSGGSAAVAAEKAAQYLAEQYNDGRTAIDPQTGKFTPNLLPESIKAEIVSLTGAIAGVVGATGDNGAVLNAQIGSVIGQNAAVNNFLASETVKKYVCPNKENQGCLTKEQINLLENLRQKSGTHNIEYFVKEEQKILKSNMSHAKKEEALANLRRKYEYDSRKMETAAGALPKGDKDRDTLFRIASKMINILPSISPYPYKEESQFIRAERRDWLTAHAPGNFNESNGMVRVQQTWIKNDNQLLDPTIATQIPTSGRGGAEKNSSAAHTTGQVPRSRGGPTGTPNKNNVSGKNLQQSERANSSPNNKPNNTLPTKVLSIPENSEKSVRINSNQIKQFGKNVSLTESSKKLQKKITHTKSNLEVSNIGENIARQSVIPKNAKEYQGKCKSNNCFDLVYIYKNEVYIVEVKTTRSINNPSITLESYNKGVQMKNKWIQNSIKELQKDTKNPGAKQTGEMLRQASRKGTPINKAVVQVTPNGVTIINLGRYQPK